MGLDPEVWEAMKVVIHKAKLKSAEKASSATLATAASASSAGAAAAAARNGNMYDFIENEQSEMQSDVPKALISDWSMVAIQTGMSLMSEIKRIRDEERKKKRSTEELDEVAERKEVHEARDDPTYNEDEAGNELIGYPDMLPFIDRIYTNMFRYLKKNKAIHTVVIRADTFAPKAKARTQEKRRQAKAIKPYSGRLYRIDVKTGQVIRKASKQIDAETGKEIEIPEMAEKTVDYGRIIFNRTSLMSELLRCMLYQLQRGRVGVWPIRDMPANTKFIFDFSDTYQLPSWRRVLRPVCLELCTDAEGVPGDVRDHEDGPISWTGEADIGVVEWVMRLGVCSVVLSGDGDQLPILAYNMERQMKEAVAKGTVGGGGGAASSSNSDDSIWSLKQVRAAGIPTVYMLKNRTADFRVENPQTSMYNINYAMVLMHRHQWSADKLALLAILGKNDFFIAEDKAVLFPGIGIQCICDVIGNMTSLQVRRAVNYQAQFRLFALWVWMSKWCITAKRRKNAKKDPPKKSFDRISEIVASVSDFDEGYAMLRKDLKTAPAAMANMDVLESAEALQHYRVLILGNMNYWACKKGPDKQFDMDPKDFVYESMLEAANDEDKPMSNDPDRMEDE